MNLRELVAAGPGLSRWQQDVEWDKEIGTVTADSRKIKKGDVFVALKGEHHDGHQYIDQALSQGALAVILENEEFCAEKSPWILVKNSREVYGVIMQALAGKPSLSMNVIGVTGTNGKTTVTNMVANIMEEAGKKIGLLGTIQNRVGVRREAALLTTPDSPQLAELFRQMKEEKTDYAIMEVSSHALAQSRTAGIEFDVAIFTNLSQDHLDYHETFNEYLAQKAKLFSGLSLKGEKKRKKTAILNLDDNSSAFLADYCRVPVITYGLNGLSHVRAEDIQLSAEGIRYQLVYGGRRQDIRLKLHGRFNVYNSLAAITAALVEGVDIEVIQRALAKMEPVSGRFQQVTDPTGKLPFNVFVDYSHTPDSLENCITTGRELCRGKIISVFGAGGHRDVTKRPLMGEVAARLSDIAIVTSDNPREEEPLAIIRDIMKGMKGPLAKAQILTEPDRRQAIVRAVSLAQPGDIVLVCGKGHENYQIVGDEKLAFDDYEEVQKAMRLVQ